jgi:integrase
MEQPGKVGRRLNTRFRWGVAHVDHQVDRHGHPRWWYRRRGERRIAALPMPGTPDFLAAWQAADKIADGEVAVLGATRSRAGSYSAALAAYYVHNSWLTLSPVTIKKRRQVLEKIRNEFGDARLSDLRNGHIQKLMNRLKPNAQKNWSKALTGFFKFALQVELVEVNPMLGVVKDKATRGTGFIAWTEDDLEKYRAHWPLGTRQRLAVEIMVNLGLRRSDAARLGPADIRGGRLTDFVPQKTKGSTGVKLTLPVRAELAEAIKATGLVNTKTFMTGEARGRVGQPFKSGESFGAWMRVQCDAAGLPEASSHGLRKLAAIRLALAGATVPQLCKVFGWSSPSMAQVYVDQADQVRMADQAMALLDTVKVKAKLSQP